MFKHLSHHTGCHLGFSGAQKVSIALQTNTSLTSLNISRVLFCLNNFHTTDDGIENSGAESILRALQSNTSLTSLAISGVLFCSNTFHATGNLIGDTGVKSISRTLQSNTSLTSLDISGVLFCSTPFTQQVTLLEILVLRAFWGHSNQTLHSNLLIFPVIVLIKHLSHTTDNLIGDYGAESISRALQSNSSLKSLDISSVFVSLLTRFTKQGTILVFLVLRRF